MNISRPHVTQQRPDKANTPRCRLAVCAVGLVRTLLPVAFLYSLPVWGMDWSFRTSSYLFAEGGWVTGSKVPLNSKSQLEYDKESAKSGVGPVAESKIKTLRLQGAEWHAAGSALAGYEGFSDDLAWQANVDAVASVAGGNGSGSFYSPPGDLIFPNQGRAGRNPGWTAGVAAALDWVPIRSFSTRLRGSYVAGADAFADSFSRLQLSPSAELKAARFIIKPEFNWQRLIAADALPAAEIRAWALDLEWLGHRVIRFKNPAGYPLLRSWRVGALGSSLVVKAMENEGSFLEINLTPSIHFTNALFLTSHFRSLAGNELSYVSPSLADAISSAGRQSGNWSPKRPSADYSSQMIEWKNTLTRKVDRNALLSLSILYTSRSAAYTPSSLSEFQYSSLIDAARESTFRYFLGCEFLL